MPIEQLALLGKILAAIEDDSLVLPTLPDVAIKLQELIDDPHVSADQIVLTLASDPFISAQLIKSANSAAFADKRQVENVRGAISRLGYRQVRNLVMAITMNKMFSAKSPLINKQMQAIWQHSREVAALSYVLAARQPHLSPDQAMLAGLVHKIGALPLCLHVEKSQVQVTEQDLLELLQKYSATIGTKLLKKWNFPNELIVVAGEHENLQRASSNDTRADYTDVITVSSLHARAPAEILWEQVAALARLGLSAEECQTFAARNAERIAAVAEMLGINAASQQPATDATSFAATASGKSAATRAATSQQSAGKLAALLRLFAFWKRA